jgi:hypothetical protein
MYTSDWYRRFGELEARGQSAVYERWAHEVEHSPELLALIDTLPRPKRQPNLIFAVSRLLGAPLEPLTPWLVDNWDAVAAEALVRSTQTNEPRRCAVILPYLPAGPLALLEVGASAGLCLYPDQYSYSYNGGAVLGDSSVLLECEASGIDIPGKLPDVVWRGGIDLNPLDVNDADDMHWLQTLIWPEQQERLARIQEAIGIARSEPVKIVAGDAVDALPALVDEVPDDATLVIFHSGVLVYMAADSRRAFADLATSLPATWISNEGAGVVPGVEGTVPPGKFALGVDGVLRAFTGPHGQSIQGA